jgi:hypothetical protein
MILDNNNNICKRLIDLLKTIRSFLLNLNIFDNGTNPELTEDEIHIKRQSTRLYIVLLILTLIILIAYTSLNMFK